MSSCEPAGTADTSNLPLEYNDAEHYYLEILSSPERPYFNGALVGDEVPVMDWRLTYYATPGDLSTPVTTVMGGTRTDFTYTSFNNLWYPVQGVTDPETGVNFRGYVRMAVANE